eukprot:gene11171-42718_t
MQFIASQPPATSPVGTNNFQPTESLALPQQPPQSTGAQFLRAVVSVPCPNNNLSAVCTQRAVDVLSNSTELSEQFHVTDVAAVSEQFHVTDVAAATVPRT